MRDFFDQAGFFEVETPLLSQDIVVDAWLEPFVADWLPLGTDWSHHREPRFLQTSPEFAMKRLIAAGADAIYQLGKVFRNGEVGRMHNPEFTMLEWYRRGDDLVELMRFTELLVQQVFTLGAQWPSGASEVSSGGKSLVARVLEPAGFEPLSSSLESLQAIAAARRLVPPPGLAGDDRDGWLNYLLAELIEPQLGRMRPTFLTNYPASQAALARLAPDGLTCERFELYIDGIELCNGYDELTDAGALRARIRGQAALRHAAGLRPLPDESRLLRAMERGLPDCSGNALGVDRLVMLALRQKKLADVISFPFEIA